MYPLYQISQKKIKNLLSFPYSPGAPVESGADVTDRGKRVGTVLESWGCHGLALLRLSAV